MEQLVIVRARVGEVSLVSDGSVGTQHVLKGLPGAGAYSSQGPGSVRTTMCRWAPAAFSAVPNPTGEPCAHNAHNIPLKDAKMQMS